MPRPSIASAIGPPRMSPIIPGIPPSPIMRIISGVIMPIMPGVIGVSAAGASASGAVVSTSGWWAAWSSSVVCEVALLLIAYGAAPARRPVSAVLVFMVSPHSSGLVVEVARG